MPHSTKLLLALILTAFLNSCSADREPEPVAATIDGQPLPLSTIDKTIELQLHRQLFEIYNLRRIATEQYTAQLALQREALSRNITVDSLIDEYTRPRSRRADVIDYAQQMGFCRGVPKVRGGIYHSLDFNTDEGFDEVRRGLIASLRQQLIDSLKTRHNITITLRPPRPPRLPLDSILAFSRGRVDAKICLTEVSDYNCPLCRSMHPLVEQLASDFESDIRYRHAIFATEASPAAIAVMAAARQDKYWDMHDRLMRSDTDSASIISIAADLQIDLDLFLSDMADTAIANSINRNIEYMHRIGLYGTPTFLINNRIVNGATDIATLRREIISAARELQ